MAHHQPLTSVRNPVRAALQDNRLTTSPTVKMGGMMGGCEHWVAAIHRDRSRTDVSSCRPDHRIHFRFDARCITPYPIVLTH